MDIQVRRSIATAAASLVILGGALPAPVSARVVETGEAPRVPPADIAEGPLLLDRVLSSVRRHYPLLRAAAEEQALAEARYLASEGAFDLRLGAGGDLKPRGFYETYRGNLELRQNTQLWGAEFFGGYRVGDGDFAVWDGDLKTNSGGEVRLGVKLPLLRDRAIDEKRAKLRGAQLDLAAAAPTILKSVLEFERTASLAYWQWVDNGMRLSLSRELLRIAEKRQQQISRRVEKGAAPQIDLADNERLILERRVRLIDAGRAFEQSTVSLSLFNRDREGRPLDAKQDQLPQTFPAEYRPDLGELDSDIATALARRPALTKLSLTVEKARVQRDLARNRILPGLDLTVAGSRDIGGVVNDPDDKSDSVLAIKVEFDLPVQRRRARGQVDAAEAELRRLEETLKFAREIVTTQVRRSVIALRAAYDQVDAARRNHELADRLRHAEQRKLDLGKSNLIDVNIRELQAFDAAAKLIRTQADYFAALANYRFALGETGA